jgi:hypothetical protein
MKPNNTQPIHAKIATGSLADLLKGLTLCIGDADSEGGQQLAIGYPTPETLVIKHQSGEEKIALPIPEPNFDAQTTPKKELPIKVVIQNQEIILHFLSSEEQTAINLLLQDPETSVGCIPHHHGGDLWSVEIIHPTKPNHLHFSNESEAQAFIDLAVEVIAQAAVLEANNNAPYA